MNSFNEKLDFKNILESDLPLEAKVNVLFDILKNVLDEGAIRARTVRFKLQNICTKCYCIRWKWS